MNLALQVLNAMSEDAGPPVNSVSTLGPGPDSRTRTVVKYQGKAYDLISKDDNVAKIQSEDGTIQEVDSKELE